MYPDDYLSSYEIVEETDGRAKIRSKIKANRCRHCDQDSVQSNGIVKKTVYDIDSRTGEMITIEVEHYRYRCKNPDCKESFTLDVLPFKCFPDTPSEGRTNKSKSRDILNSAMDYLLLGSDENGNPVTVSAAAKKYGYDRKVLSTELHSRVNTTLNDYILSNEVCEQAALVPFMYRGIKRCAILGYTRDDINMPLRPVLYDIRDTYDHEDLVTYLKEFRFQNLITPKVTYLEMNADFIDMIHKFYIDVYQKKCDSIFIGIIKLSVKENIFSTSAGNLSHDFGLLESFYFYMRRLEAFLYDKILEESDDDTASEILIDADFAQDDSSFYDILDIWKDELIPEIVAKKLQPLYEKLYAFADLIDISMTHYREDGVCPEDELGFVQYFHQRNVDFAEMRYRVHLLSKNHQNVSFQSLITGQYKPSSHKTLRSYYIDLREINALFRD